MKNLFRNNQEQKENPSNGFPNKVAEFVKKHQLNMAKWLQVKSERLALRTKWVLLFLFSAAIFCVCIFLIAGKFFGGETNSPVTIARISLPVKPEVLKPSTTGISKAEYDKIVSYGYYLDSLKNAPQGNREYQRIISRHPGLQDSIKILEHVYQSQFKK